MIWSVTRTLSHRDTHRITRVTRCATSYRRPMYRIPSLYFLPGVLPARYAQCTSRRTLGTRVLPVYRATMFREHKCRIGKVRRHSYFFSTTVAVMEGEDIRRPFRALNFTPVYVFTPFVILELHKFTSPRVLPRHVTLLPPPILPPPPARRV